MRISEVSNWLDKHKEKYEKLKSHMFPSLNNEFSDLYSKLKIIENYFSFNSVCYTALYELQTLFKNNHEKICEWADKYKKLGTEDLILFPVDFPEIFENHKLTLKVTASLYIEAASFNHIICFCKIFQVLYWDKDFSNTSKLKSYLNDLLN